VKNLLVGWLCISPLWGATTLATATHLAEAGQPIVRSKIALLAATGLSLGFVREVLKDVEDVDLDKGTKLTILGRLAWMRSIGPVLVAQSDVHYSDQPGTGVKRLRAGISHDADYLIPKHSAVGEWFRRLTESVGGIRIEAQRGYLSKSFPDSG